MQPSPTALSSCQRLLGRNATAQLPLPPGPWVRAQGHQGGPAPRQGCRLLKRRARGRDLLGDSGHRSEASPGLSILLHEHGGFCSQASVRKEEKTYAHPVNATVQHRAGSASTSAPPKGPPALPLIRSRSLMCSSQTSLASGSPWSRTLFSH